MVASSYPIRLHKIGFVQLLDFSFRNLLALYPGVPALHGVFFETADAQG